MAARSARHLNHAFRVLHERLIAAGKVKKGALSAVANKLIKQFLSVIKKDPLDNDYEAKLSLGT